MIYTRLAWNSVVEAWRRKLFATLMRDHSDINKLNIHDACSSHYKDSKIYAVESFGESLVIRQIRQNILPPKFCLVRYSVPAGECNYYPGYSIKIH